MPDESTLLQRLAAITRPIFLLDYDGTLVPIASLPEQAGPDPALIDLLRSAGSAGPVHIVSGRAKADLEAWFGDLPVSLWAEHGAWRRPGPAEGWRLDARISMSWLPEVRAMLIDLAARTPGTLVEEKSVSVAWHYRTAEPAVSDERAHDVRQRLVDALRDAPADILQGSKVIEVRSKGIHKGRVVEQVLRFTEDPSQVIAIGDDRTDEDMFAALPPEAVAVHVGAGPTQAAYRLPDSDAVRALILATGARTRTL